MADESVLMQQLRAAHNSGDKQKAAVLAESIRKLREVSAGQKKGVDAALTQLAVDTPWLEKLAVATGKGFYNIGRGLGLVDAPGDTEQKGYEALAAESPKTTMAGEIIGETAPFLLPTVAAAKIPAIGARAASMAGIGAAQSGLASAGRGESGGTQLASAGLGGALAGGLELAFPHIGRIGGAIIRRVSGRPPAGALIDDAGRLSPEMLDALKKIGMTEDEFTAQVTAAAQAGQAPYGAITDLTQFKPGTSPDQVARMALFQSERIPFTRGDITQDFADVASERTLAELATDPNAQPFRAYLAGQSKAIRDRLTATTGGLGAAEGAGTSAKSALLAEKGLLRGKKNALYGEARELAKESGGLPINAAPIASAIPDANTLDDLAITSPSAIASLDKALIKYGVKAAPDGYQGAITPLSIENFESFRKLLGNIERADQSGAAGVAIGPIRSSLDAQLDALPESVANPALAQKLRDARSTVRQIKTEFSPQALAGRLIETKRDGVTEAVEASKAIPVIFSNATPIEQVKKTVQILSRSDAGKKSIGDMQAAAFLQVADAAFGSGTNKVGDVVLLSPGAYKAAVDKIGKEKLNILFSGNQKALKTMENFFEIATLKQAPSGAVPKGSASKLTELFHRFAASRFIPMGQTFMDVVAAAKGAGDTGRSARAAMNPSPKVIDMEETIKASYPNVWKVITGAGRPSAAAATGAIVGDEQ